MILGFSIAAPIGPIGLLCIRKTLTYGRIHGFASGFGTATADAIYASIAALGLHLISSFLTGSKFILGLIGGIFLIYIGIKSICIKSSVSLDTIYKESLFKTFITTFLLTLTNPLTIVSFFGIFAGLNFVSVSPIIIITGVFCGSLLWWFVLSTVVSWFKERLSNRFILATNRICGLFIVGFGCFAIIKAFL